MQTSPWGKVQYEKAYAEGITGVSTAGHGGIKLDRKHNALVHKAWRRAGGWYEEDCDVVIVILTFPAAFSEKQVEEARKSAKSDFPDEYTAVTGETVSLAESRVLRLRRAKEAARGKYQAKAAYGSWARNVPVGMVGVFARLDGEGEEKYFLVPVEEYTSGADTVFAIDTARHAEVPGPNPFG